MNRINPAKLLLSKWTAARPRNKEKHFLVTELFRDDEGTVLEIPAGYRRLENRLEIANAQNLYK